MDGEWIEEKKKSEKQKNFPHSGEWLSANRTVTDHLRGKERKVIFPIVRNRGLLAIIVWRG